jgi:hypothetical protein
MNIFKKILVLYVLTLFGIAAKGQGIPLDEILIVSNSPLKEHVDPEIFRSFMIQEFVPAWNQGSPNAPMYFLQADRGDRNGEFLTICITNNQGEGKIIQKKSPFTDRTIASRSINLSSPLSEFLEKPEAYTVYQLVGANQFTSLPPVELLGIHYIQVKPERAKDFEKFVIEKLHPAVGHLVDDMNLFYYKAVAGQDKGSYITIFAIESVAARERFWPTGGSEQDIVKQLFGPYKELAKELGTCLVEDSYLKPESGGGAAYFESLHWTDYVVIKVK